ncbi:MAG: NTP transferase domain-containing protein [Candidatus Promineifilaceae bacterium]|nr:NTP transferase domain-containing protein [Candidatus Promineifilaceae bacterium]
MMDIWTLIPVKSLKESKRRLARLLPAEQRAILIHGLLQHELMILEEIPAITQVLVVSSDPAVWQLARQFDAQVVEEIEPQGLNIAIARGMAVASQNGAQGVLILPVDLPFITISDITAVVNIGLEEKFNGNSTAKPLTIDGNGSPGADGLQHVMAICADEDGDGTNALFFRPPSEFSFHFGPGSFRLHIDEAHRRGLTVRTVTTPGLQFDLDNEKDWHAYQQMISMPDT